jgi:AcrR family transcriptional regulator
MSADSTAERGRPKGDKRARTRAKLIEAARRAGMTTGAIYGNFKNRDELFITLAQTYWAPIVPDIRPGTTFAEKMRAFAEATLAALPERRLAVVGYLAGRAYALGHEETWARVRELTAESYAQGAAWLETLAQDEELPMPPQILVAVIHALTEGLVLQRLLTPELVPDEAFYAAFAALAGEASSKPTPS